MLYTTSLWIFKKQTRKQIGNVLFLCITNPAIYKASEETTIYTFIQVYLYSGVPLKIDGIWNDDDSLHVQKIQEKLKYFHFLSYLNTEAVELQDITQRGNRDLFVLHRYEMMAWLFKDAYHQQTRCRVMFHKEEQFPVCLNRSGNISILPVVSVFKLFDIIETVSLEGTFVALYKFPFVLLTWD